MNSLYDHECVRCPLWERANTVCMEGRGRVSQLGIMVVGEAPGRDEDAAGRPFIGRAGALLDQALTTALGSLWDVASDVFVTNVVKCRPPSNRTPSTREMQMCEPYLRKEISLHNPFVVIALGNAAIWSLLRETGITRIRGEWFQLDRQRETWVMPTYHPAFVGYQGGVGSQAWELFVEDIEVAVNRANERK